MAYVAEAYNVQRNQTIKIVLCKEHFNKKNCGYSI